MTLSLHAECQELEEGHRILPFFQSSFVFVALKADTRGISFSFLSFCEAGWCVDGCSRWVLQGVCEETSLEDLTQLLLSLS